MRILYQTFFAVCVSFSLSACAVPVAFVTYASYVSNFADGISYISTGKSVLDNGVSSYMEEDCAMWHVLTSGKICSPNKPAKKPLAIADSARVGSLEVSTGLPPDNLAFDFGAKHGASPASVVQRASIPTLSPDQAAPATLAQAPGIYLVLASFLDIALAQDLMTRQAALTPALMEVDVMGRHYYRVIVGPHTDIEIKSLRAHLIASGYDDVWPLVISSPDNLATAPLLAPSGA